MAGDAARPETGSAAGMASLTGGLDRAFLLARRVLRDDGLAQDAVQEASIRYLRRPPADQGKREAAAPAGEPAKGTVKSEHIAFVYGLSLPRKSVRGYDPVQIGAAETPT